MRWTLLVALLAVTACSSPLTPSPVRDVPDAQPTTLPASIAPTPPPVGLLADCTPTLSPDFPVSSQAEKVAWLIIEVKAHLRTASTVLFDLEEADATKRPIHGVYTEPPISGPSVGLHYITVPNFQTVDRREIAAGLIRWSVGVNLDIKIKGAPVVDCLPETHPITLQLAID